MFIYQESKRLYNNKLNPFRSALDEEFFWIFLMKLSCWREEEESRESAISW